MEHIRDIRGDARHNARRRAGEGRDEKRALSQSDDSHLTMLRPLPWAVRFCWSPGTDSNFEVFWKSGWNWPP